MAGKPTKKSVKLRARVWVEGAGGKAVMTEAGADLLEQIEVWGSLSEAARRLRYAYRRAWMMLDAMNRAWEVPVVETAVGGKEGGGAKLTEHGRAVLAGYREVQMRVEHAVDVAGAGFLAGTGTTLNTKNTKTRRNTKTG